MLLMIYQTVVMRNVSLTISIEVYFILVNGRLLVEQKNHFICHYFTLRSN